MKHKLAVFLMAVVVAMGLLFGATAASAAIIGVAIDSGTDIPENWNGTDGGSLQDLIDEDGNTTTVNWDSSTGFGRTVDQTPTANTVPVHTTDLFSLNTFGESNGESLTVTFRRLDENLVYNVWVIGLSNEDIQQIDWTITGATTLTFVHSGTAGQLIFNSEVGSDSRTFSSYALQVMPDAGAPGNPDDSTITITGTATGLNQDVDVAGFAIEPLPPVADVGGPYEGVTGVAVSFDGTASEPPPGGSIVSYAWDFGDSNTDDTSGAEPSHTYTVDSTYDVTLTVTDSNGATDQDVTTAIIAVGTTNLPPEAVAGGPYPGDVNVPVNFIGSGSDDGSIVLWEWDFDGDGNVDDTGRTPSHTYTIADIYNVILTVTDDDGLKDSDTTQATIALAPQSPVANAGGPYEGKAEVEMNFDGSTSIDPDGDIVQYDWNYGDGSPWDIDAGEKPSYTYITGGERTVTLRVTDNDGTTDLDIASASIAAGNIVPVANAGGPYPGLINTPIIFDGTGSFDQDGTIATWEWDFDNDGTVDASGATPTHTYTVDSTYDVTLTVTDNEDAANSHSTVAAIFAVNEPPVADAGGPYTGTASVDVDFNGSLSRDLDGNIAQYDWDYGDGTPIETNAGPTPSHSYAAAGAGTYDVILTVTDDDGGTDVDITTAAIDQVNQTPVAEAGGPYTGTVNVAVTFDSTGSSDADGNITQYDWNYGDGSPMAINVGPTPSHPYTAAGLYRVVVVVTDDGAASDANGDLVYIGAGNQPPVADTGGPYTGAVNVAVNFNGSGSTDDGSIVLWEWDFDGDGTVDDISGPTPSHTYTAAGLYRVNLRVRDNLDVINTDSTLALIGLPPQSPVANAGGPYTGAAGVAVAFDGSASIDPDGNIEQYDWDYVPQ